MTTDIGDIVKTAVTKTISISPNKSNQSFTVDGRLLYIMHYSGSSYSFNCFLRIGTASAIPSYYFGTSGYSSNTSGLFLYGYSYAKISSCTVSESVFTISTNNDKYTESD